MQATLRAMSAGSRGQGVGRLLLTSWRPLDMAINNKAKMASKAHKNLTRVERANERAGQNVICQMHSPSTSHSKQAAEAERKGKRESESRTIKVENEINIRIASIKLSELASQIL